MSACPDRLALFMGIEEGDPGIDAHIAQCEACQALVSAERALDSALEGMRDPAPPAELFAAVMQRVDDAQALTKRIRRQTAAALAVVTFVLAAAFALIGADGLVESTLSTIGALSAARVTLTALGRSLDSVAPPLMALEALALLTAALMLHRLVAVRVRA